jgi:hypothetical protein
MVLGAVLLCAACREEPTIVIRFEPIDMAGVASRRDMAAKAVVVDAGAPVLQQLAATGKPECKKADDCAAVPEECCTCAQGGKLRAVPKAAAAKIASDCKKAQMMCAQVMSSDPSCTMKPACVAGRCTLQK